ncbi:Fucose-binding lectin II [Rhizobium sp. CF080]|uniref:Fucose-binding lectin II (PA-IIL) n=1 Tax=Rhizobium sp. (strain CF080) TaxID=1144310 RepID=UPI00027189BB|nr:Fucose-binding lectin II (PA-IIL) [Rhizobium sp. CF080]EUB97567.1 Fucose-binding lectin II [Rhizobium sp. CF080]
MPATILLPPSTNVFVTALTNAADLQKVTITVPGASPILWQGTGEGNHQIGSTFVMTPSGSQDVQATVDVQHSANGGNTWQESALLPGGCSIGTMNLQVLLSEDQVDRDYNDAVVQFLWWVPLS